MNLRLKHDGILLKHFSKMGTNIPYVLFSVYFVLYLALTLTILQLQIYPLENRITYFDRVVYWSITGSLQQDILIASAIYGTAVLFTFKKYVSLPLSIMMIASSVTLLVVQDYGENYNSVLFISSLPILLILLTISNLSYRKKEEDKKLQLDKGINHFNFQKFLIIFFIVFSVFELLVFLNWLIYPMALDKLLGSWYWKLNLLENSLFYSFGLLSSSLILLSILSFLIKPNVARLAFPLKKYFTNKISQHANSPDDKFSTLKRNDLSHKSTNYFVVIQEKFNTIFQSGVRTLLLLFVVAFLTSILVSFYPYLFVAEPDALLGTDIPVYSQQIDLLEASSSDPSDFFYQLFAGILSGDRPLSLLSLYLPSVISGQTLETLKYMPAILGPLLAFAVYFLTRVAYPKNRKIAFLAALMTLFSHQLLIGFYAAFYANWMALITLAVSSIFLLKSVNEKNHTHRNLILFFIFTTSTLFFHSYTWSYFIALITLFLVWTVIQRKRAKQSVKVIIILGLITASIVGIDTIKSYYAGSADSFEKDLQIAEFRVGLDEFAQRWQNLSTTFTVHLGGFFTNSAILLLLFLWTLKANYNNNSDRFFLSMIFVALLPILFGDFLVQSRIFCTS